MPSSAGHRSPPSGAVRVSPAWAFALACGYGTRTGVQVGQMVCPDCETSWNASTDGGTCWCCGEPGEDGTLHDLLWVPPEVRNPLRIRAEYDEHVPIAGPTSHAAIRAASDPADTEAS
ncbi:MAG: hypothetical protein HOQ22_02095 [Nocardioidaceae bacterium]|nr:hypothetical protein [Nocardioidaceae bacterium]NUS49816.1 hypothetical protein [Nocardioidaceae bacterium]